jgi:hypothetical protein
MMQMQISYSNSRNSNHPIPPSDPSSSGISVSMSLVGAIDDVADGDLVISAVRVRSNDPDPLKSSVRRKLADGPNAAVAGRVLVLAKSWLRLNSFVGEKPTVARKGGDAAKWPDTIDLSDSMYAIEQPNLSDAENVFDAEGGLDAEKRADRGNRLDSTCAIEGRKRGDAEIPVDAEGGVDAVKQLDSMCEFDSKERDGANNFVATIGPDADHWSDALNDWVDGLYR